MFYIFDISIDHPDRELRENAWKNGVRFHLDEADLKTKKLSRTCKFHFPIGEKELLVFDSDKFTTYKIELSDGNLKRLRANNDENDELFPGQNIY